ncbi:MAG TPA: polyprenyl synthetase family protein [Baekduia sp.]|nr:polyprenyl synthetase family protein [Baekduia sp.]
MSAGGADAGGASPAAAQGGPVTAIVHAGGPHVLPLLDRVEAVLRDAAAGHGPVLAQHAGATIAAGGKRLRPLLVILAAGGEVAATGADGEGLVRAAAAVELVHSATLVHDDVLDLAPLRRGRPTVFASAGRAAATQTGDLLFSRAFALLAANGDPAQVRALSDAGSALARGELLQRADAFDAAITVHRYLRRCELKTARLFEAACILGALEGADDGGGAQRAEALREFGRRIGLAFQILDDVLDVAGPAERTGKHRGTDLLDGTVTLPFILARERDPELAALDPRAISTPQDAEAVCDRIAATGALDEARAAALEHVAAAKAVVPARLADRERNALLLVADGVVARYS